MYIQMYLLQYTHSNCYMILIHVFLMFTTVYDHNTCVSVITMSSFTPVTMTVLVIIDCCWTKYKVYLTSSV